MSQALLSEAELELMHVLWLGGPVTVREVMAVVQDGRAYTTFSTILRILEQKGFATSERVGRAHRYRAVLPGGPRAKPEADEPVPNAPVSMPPKGPPTFLLFSSGDWASDP